MADKNDWRLRGQEDYLAGVDLYYIPFEPFSAEWDHEHCEFCWGKFSLYSEGMKIGYCTKTKNERKARWICETCYEDFKEDFGWNLKKI